MATFTDTFKRKEVKYKLTERQYRYVLAQIAPYMELDAFGQTRITSLYFDTLARDLIARSLEKPLYKEKLRVRWYGVPQPGDRAYVEIKKKFKGIVYKRRVGCTREAAAAMLMHGVPYLQACGNYPLADEVQQRESLGRHSFQIAEEIKQFVNLHGPLYPSMYIQCERRAFALRSQEAGEESVQEGCSDGVQVGCSDGVQVGCSGGVLADRLDATKGGARRNAQSGTQEGCSSGAQSGAQTGRSDAVLSSVSFAGDLRLTFDSGIAYRDALAEAEGAAAVYRPLLAPGEVIMEIKTSGAFPFWLVEALNACGARPSSFSKYGTAYMQVMGMNNTSHEHHSAAEQKECMYA